MQALYTVVIKCILSAIAVARTSMSRRLGRHQDRRRFINSFKIPKKLCEYNCRRICIWIVKGYIYADFRIQRMRKQSVQFSFGDGHMQYMAYMNWYVQCWWWWWWNPFSWNVRLTCFPFQMHCHTHPRLFCINKFRKNTYHWHRGICYMIALRYYCC